MKIPQTQSYCADPTRHISRLRVWLCKVIVIPVGPLLLRRSYKTHASLRSALQAVHSVRGQSASQIKKADLSPLFFLVGAAN